MTPTKKKELKPLIECDFTPNLDETLSELNITRNALAVEAKIRPQSINELVSGKSKQINFVTLQSIIETLNHIAEEKGIKKKFNVTDIFEYKPEQGDAE